MNKGLLLGWAVASAVFCGSLDLTTRPVLTDNQLYFYLAERAASGVPPHVSHVDSKQQLGSLITAGAIRAGRAVEMDDVVASRLLSLLFTALSIAMLAELAATLAGSAAAGHIAALSLLAVRGFAEHTAAGNNVKVLMATFLIAAHLAATRSSRGRWADFVAGAAAGAAFLCWQPALVVLAALAVEALWQKEGGTRRLLRLLAAAALPVAAYELYFALHGALGVQLHQAFVMAAGSARDAKRFLPSVIFLLTEGTNDWTPPRAVPFAALAMALLALLGAAVAPRRALERLRERAGLLSVLLAGVGATVFTLVDHQGVPDLFFPDPYFAIATGFLAVTAGAALARRTRPAAAVVVAAAFAAALLWQIRDDVGRRFPPDYSLQDQHRIARALRIYREHFGSVWGYGAVHLLGLAGLDNHVPYGLFYDDIAREIPFHSYRPLAGGRMPEVIVHSRGALPGGEAYLASEYVEITPPAFARQSIMVWRRVAAQPGGLAEGDLRDFEGRPRFVPPASLPARGAWWERPKVPHTMMRTPGASAPPGHGKAAQKPPDGAAAASKGEGAGR